MNMNQVWTDQSVEHRPRPLEYADTLGLKLNFNNLKSIKKHIFMTTTNLRKIFLKIKQLYFVLRGLGLIYCVSMDIVVLHLLNIFTNFEILRAVQCVICVVGYNYCCLDGATLARIEILYYTKWFWCYTFCHPKEPPAPKMCFYKEKGLSSIRKKYNIF